MKKQILFFFVFATIVLIATACGSASTPLVSAPTTASLGKVAASGKEALSTETPTATKTPDDTARKAAQANCEALSKKYGNVAHSEDGEWVNCFLGGWVNWIFGTENGKPLPEIPPQAVADALKKGLFVQLTEPWRAGCDGSLKSKDCNIGYLKLFSDWGTLKAFLAKGEITQGTTTKVGPWTIGSLWMTDNFIQVANGDQMSTNDKKLFCAGQVGLAFAYDGGYPLPSSAPCEGTNNTYVLREVWNGGCIGDVVNDRNCNVGKMQTYKDWGQMIEFLKNNGVLNLIVGNAWNRGSVWANRPDMAESAGIR